MTVWIVTKFWCEEKSWDEYVDHWENVGVYSTEKKARQAQEELINQNAYDVQYLGAEPIDVVIEEFKVE